MAEVIGYFETFDSMSIRHNIRDIVHALHLIDGLHQLQWHTLQFPSIYGLTAITLVRLEGRITNSPNIAGFYWKQ